LVVAPIERFQTTTTTFLLKVLGYVSCPITSDSYRTDIGKCPTSDPIRLQASDRRKYAVCKATKPDKDNEDDDNDNNKGNSKEKKGEDESGKKSVYRDELAYGLASLTERRRLF